MLTRHSTELADPGGGPITGGQVVPSHWRNSHQSGPMPLSGDTGGSGGVPWVFRTVGVASLFEGDG